MVPVGKGKPRRARREFTPEFKAEIVELCRRGDRTISQVVTDFDLVDSAVRRWIAQAEAEANPRSGMRCRRRRSWRRCGGRTPGCSGMSIF
ncbi:transposase [Amycolatopsis tucumanensis]|uniref:transposase n=1 Tax=Amycolatopsis tucumanensis TaxID=401106 RepID=UPI003D761DA5